MYCAICNNPFSVSTIEEHADLCLDNKTFFFERQPESSYEEKSVSMIDEKTEMRGHLDQPELVSAIYRQLRKCEIDEEHELAINVRRGFCFKDFLKTFKKSWNIKRMYNKYSITFIRESGIGIGGVSRKFYSGFVRIFHFLHFFFNLNAVYVYVFCIFRDSNRGRFIKKVFLNTSQNSQENTCPRVSILIKLQARLQIY